MTGAPRSAAYKNERAIRGMRGDGGSGAHLYNLAVFLPCHSAAPPPVSAYEAWLAAARSADPRGKTSLTGMKLRRAVIMKRGGQSDSDISRAIGLCKASVFKWLGKLPPELAA